MPRDDYARATAKQRGRRERWRLDYETKKQPKKKRYRRKHVSSVPYGTIDFPAHDLVKQPDGTYLGKPMKFSVNRWAGIRTKANQ